MTIVGTGARENFPAIGTVRNPSLFYDGDDLFLCYQIAPLGGGGNAVIRFGAVIEFRNTPVNVDELRQHRYPAQCYAFNEISNAEETLRWNALEPKFWVISFHDMTVEVLFEDAALVLRTQDEMDPSITLLKFLRDTECQKAPPT